MRCFPIAALVGLTLLPAGAGAFEFSSGDIPVLSPPACYVGDVAFLDNGNYLFSLSVTGTDATDCYTRLGNTLNFFHNLHGYDWKVHPSACTTLRSPCVISLHSFNVAPGVSSEHVLKLRERFRVDEFDRALQTLLRLGPTAGSLQD